jgi:HEAT repeat protein
MRTNNVLPVERTPMPTGHSPDEMLRNLSLPMLCGQFALLALPIVCGLASQNITSYRRGLRLLSAECLGDSGNPTAVPVLLQAIERYERDAHFVEIAVKSLTRLGDVRALPTLRRLTHDRNLALMTAARYAIASIEPKVVLLRASSAPSFPHHQELLRPLVHTGSTEPEELLRVSASPL